MTFLSYFIICLVTFFVVWTLQKMADRIQGLPPGPFRIPLVGNIFQALWENPTNLPLAWIKMSKYYGDIIHMQFGITSIVVVNGFENLHNVFHSDDFLGKPDDKIVLERSFGKPLGLLFGHLDIWKESRRFTVKTLKEFGFGVKSTMESCLQTELEELSKHICDKICGGEIYIQMLGLFDTSVINVVYSMVIGERYRFEDPTLKQLVNVVNMFFSVEIWQHGLVFSYPFLTRYALAQKFLGFDKQSKCTKLFQTFLRNKLDTIRTEGKYLTYPTNYTEAFLQKIDTRASTGTIDDVTYSDENLITILYDLLAASAESTSKSLSFAILYTILNPDVQEEVIKEIDCIIGRERLPQLSDRERMPYTVATLHEVSRISSVLPSVPMKALKDTRIGKYKIAKGTLVLANIYGASMDDKYWDDPEKFMPKRFICPNTGKIINTEKIFPFGAGKANCIGEHTARAIIFIVYTGLIQKFRLDINPTEGKPISKIICGVTNSTYPFTASVTLRK